MIQPRLGTRPTLTCLSPNDKQAIHEAALEVLADVGMVVLHDDALAQLRQAGCSVGDNGLTKFPRSLVEQALSSAPRSIPIWNRKGVQAMDLGEYRAYFGTGSDLIHTVDLTTGERHRSVLEDVRRAAKLCDGLENIDFVMSLAHPSDVPPHRSYVAAFWAMAQSSIKPIVCTADDGADLAEIWEIAQRLRGGAEHLRNEPYVVHYAEPISPLAHPASSVNKLLFCADKAIPLVYSPAPIAGSTAPMTMAGHLTQGLAECLSGLVMHQIAAPGAPFLMGMGPAVLDMSTVQCSYNAPEYYLVLVGMIEMAHHYGLPSWGYAGTSDAQIPDGQATLEAAMQTFIGAMAGANLNHDVGYLDFGRTGSLEMVAIVDELVGQFRRMLCGIPVDADHLAVEVIRTVGPQGHFLMEDHTRDHLRATQWRPKLIYRDGYEQWTASGKSTLRDRARRRVLDILEGHHPEPVPSDLARDIQPLVEP